MTDKERLDWLQDNLWNGWGIWGGYTIDDPGEHKATYIVSHKSGDPHIERRNLRSAIDAAMAAGGGAPSVMEMQQRSRPWK